MLIVLFLQCIIQSYLKWLQDSDYISICKLCEKDLNDETKDTVRLLCYDVFHIQCLNKWGREMPQTTAPAGYVCPTCSGPIFPPENAKSPVAEQLRQSLSSLTWANNNLDLPLKNGHKNTSFSYEIETNDLDKSIPEEKSVFVTSTPVSAKKHRTFKDEGIENISSSRKLQDTQLNINPTQSFQKSTDHDVDKYARRSAFKWLKRLISNKVISSSYSKTNRYLMLLILSLLIFLSVIVFMSTYGRSRADFDPFLDPMANPNIHIGSNN